MLAYVDGSCLDNPGTGGWGLVLLGKGASHCLWGGALETTNNRMELTAAIHALRSIEKGDAIEIHCDSKYVINGIEKWLPGWIKKNWRSASKKPVKNVDLWRELAALREVRKVRWVWVRGHTGDWGNECADKIAYQAALAMQAGEPSEGRAELKLDDIPPGIRELATQHGWQAGVQTGDNKAMSAKATSDEISKEIPKETVKKAPPATKKRRVPSKNASKKKQEDAQNKRLVVLDTETTGLEASKHKIIEVGCVEIVDREITGREYRSYVNPQREMDPEATKVHGITTEQLQGEPVFSAIADDLLAFIDGDPLVIHNAAFDMSFLRAEFAHSGKQFKNWDKGLKVFDSLQMARDQRPGQPNSLDHLLDHFGIKSSRGHHGALLDAQLLAKVYLALTGGQRDMVFSSSGQTRSESTASEDWPDTVRIEPSAEELRNHAEFLGKIGEQTEPIWEKT